MNNQIDIRIGKRIRERRLICGLSQAKLGEATGVSFQNIRSFENGQNRITTEKLYELAKVLSVNISYFFVDDDLNGHGFNCGNIGSGEISRLVREYRNIKDEELRKVIRLLIKSIAIHKN